MTAMTPERTSARERLLTAASELFYEEGVHSVGIDRVIERAGVAKATLYSAFGSKDELIRAYLMRRHLAWREHLARELARYPTPRERLLGVFDVIGETFTVPGYRGCAYVNARAESRPGSPVEEVSDLARGWLRAQFAELAREAGVAGPGPLAGQLALLYHGAVNVAAMDRDPAAAALARGIAATLLDAAATPG
ncbi:MAG TPA: TetR/AcrR family transcriptional regulator [Streptosporangiaceae bacterium]|jgi:AcrR family transcriptional regulator